MQQKNSIETARKTKKNFGKFIMIPFPTHPPPSPPPNCCGLQISLAAIRMHALKMRNCAFPLDDTLFSLRPVPRVHIKGPSRLPWCSAVCLNGEGPSHHRSIARYGIRKSFRRPPRREMVVKMGVRLWVVLPFPKTAEEAAAAESRREETDTGRHWPRATNPHRPLGATQACILDGPHLCQLQPPAELHCRALGSAAKEGVHNDG